MNDPQAILARLKALVEARKAAVRIRIIDRAFAQLAAACLLLPLTAQAAPFRQVTPPVRSPVVRGAVYVFNNPLIVQAAPRIEKPDHWDAARASYFQRRYGGPIFAPIR